MQYNKKEAIGDIAMMNLQAVKDAVEHLSPDELVELRRHVEQLTNVLVQDPVQPEERIRRLDEAANAIRSSFTEEQWDEVEKAMNEEYIEPWDSSEWSA
jgi:hypothetical protein